MGIILIDEKRNCAENLNRPVVYFVVWIKWRDNISGRWRETCWPRRHRFVNQENRVCVCREAREITSNNVLLVMTAPRSEAESQKNAHNCVRLDLVRLRWAESTPKASGPADSTQSLLRHHLRGQLQLPLTRISWTDSSHELVSCLEERLAFSATAPSGRVVHSGLL